MTRIETALRETSIVFIAFTALVIAGLAVRPLRAEGDAPPNVLLILADDLGWGDLSSYGARDLRTPAIDGLVERGMRFESFYANSPVCSPTRAALLTGRYPELAGVPGVIRTHPENSWGWLSPSVKLLPELLAERGYHSAIVGKWHLGLESPNTPTERGFDHFHGFLGDMMDDYLTHRRHGINYLRRQGETIDPEGHATDLFTRWAVEYLHARARAPEGKPFFLYLAYNAPHTPIQPPEDWLGKVKAREPDIPEKRARLVALIEHMDAGIGRVLEALEESGLAEDTLVVFTSDNGGQLGVGARNGRLRAGKGTVYEGGIKVPAVAVWPEKIEPGSRSDRVLLSMDVFPTILEAAGVPLEHEVDGRSFLPLLLGQDLPPLERDVFFIRREGGLGFGGETIEAVRRGSWKLLQPSPFASLELYHLDDDPLEEHDLAGERRDIVRDLARSLRRQIQRGGAVPWQAARQ